MLTTFACSLVPGTGSSLGPRFVGIERFVGFLLGAQRANRCRSSTNVPEDTCLPSQEHGLPGASPATDLRHGNWLILSFALGPHAVAHKHAVFCPPPLKIITMSLSSLRLFYVVTSDLRIHIAWTPETGPEMQRGFSGGANAPGTMPITFTKLIPTR